MMSQELQQLWWVCNGRARAEVGPDGARARFRWYGSFRRRLHVSSYPSFSNPVGYELLEAGGPEAADRRWIVVRRQWRMDLDHARFEAASRAADRPLDEPQIEEHATQVDNPRAERWLDLFKTVDVRLPVDPPDFIGLDGTRYVVVIGHVYGTFRASWWEKGPKGWGPLVGAARRFLKEAAKCDGWSDVPLDDQEVRAWAVWASGEPTLDELHVARRLSASLADRPMTELRREASQSTRLHLGFFPESAARDLQETAAAAGLRVELTPGGPPVSPP